jgi:predicted nucleic acid-binding Zn ribbon protein
MTGENEACPFCATPIPTGAVVCRGCGANKGIKGEVIWPILFFGAFWLFWGPVMGVLGLVRFGEDDKAAGICVLGLVVTVVGFFPMRWMCRAMMEPVWRRNMA